jgi:nucleoid DNA-binding protein
MTRFELLGKPYGSTILELKEPMSAKIVEDDETKKVKFKAGEKFRFLKMNVKLNFVLGESVKDKKVYKFKLKKMLKRM